MEAIDEARELLTLSELNLPNSPKIVRIDVEPYMTYDGEDALQVRLILDEGTRDSDLKGDAIWAIEKKILDRVLKAKIGLYPYFRFAKQSELDELAHDPEA